MPVTDVLLEAQQLGRRLGDTAAVSDISLNLKRGDILGLLGLNGAGKSTTLRMLAGVLIPDTGSVTVCGHSMQDEPLAARQAIGFLPDQPPLFNDMRVQDYLLFCARLHRLSAQQAADRVSAVSEQCNLLDKQRSRIHTLSKGYRQRVGLAQALVHTPDVVLLDEPGNGLDPQQLEDMRSVIRSVGATRSLVFSTHQLSEARAVCNRIAIIHAGRLVADRPADGDDLDQLFREATLQEAALPEAPTGEATP